jgi:glutathione S-transferase
VSKLASENLKLVDMDLMKGDHKTPEFIKLNPRHCVPTLKDNRFVLTESRAIANYLVDKYSSADLAARYPGIWGHLSAHEKALVDEMLHYDIGTLYKRIGEWVYPQLFRNETGDDEKLAMVRKSLEYLNDKIQEHKGGLCSGHLSLADLSVACSLSMLDFFDDIDWATYPFLDKWRTDIHALPQWKKVNEAFEAWVQSKKGIKVVDLDEDEEKSQPAPTPSPKKKRKTRARTKAKAPSSPKAKRGRKKKST